MNKLKFYSLDFQIRIGELYEKCKSEKQVDWLREEMLNIIDCLGEERIEEIEMEQIKMRIKKKLQNLLDEYNLYITNNIIGNIELDRKYKYLVYTNNSFKLEYKGNSQNEIIEQIASDIMGISDLYPTINNK